MKTPILIAALVALSYAYAPPHRAAPAPTRKAPRSALYGPPVQRTITVAAGQDPQAALDSAACGDRVVLQAGAEFYTPALEVATLTLRNKGCTFANPITITTSNEAGLPAPGRRITLAHAPAMPKLVAKFSTPTIETEPGASGYRLVGLEAKPSAGVQNQGLVYVGQSAGTVRQTTYETVPSDIEFDRCWIHGLEDGTDSPYVSARMGMTITGRNVRVVGSRVAGFRAWYPGTTTKPQTFALLFERGPGPYLVENNYIEAWFVPIFTGGGPQWRTNRATVSSASLTQATFSNTNNLNVGDLVALRVTGGLDENPERKPVDFQAVRVTAISGNTITYVPARGLEGGGSPLNKIPDMPGEALWKGDMVRNLSILRNTIVLNAAVAKQVAAASAPGEGYGKGFIELKIGENVPIEGNRFEGPAHGFTFTARNQSGVGYFGSDVWATLRNVTFRNNLKVETDGFHRSHLFGIQLEDNIHTSTPGGGVLVENNLAVGNVTSLTQQGGAPGVVFRRNTVLNTGVRGERAVFVYGDRPQPGLTLDSNIFPNGEYGIVSAAMPLDAALPGRVFTGNVVIDDRSPEQRAFEGPLVKWGAGALIVGALAEIGFGPDWSLPVNSPYGGRGVDVARLNAALSAEGGTTPTPTPTPVVPTPTPTPPPPTPTPTPRPTPVPVVDRVVWKTLSSTHATRIKQINEIERNEGLRFVGCTTSTVCYFSRF